MAEAKAKAPVVLDLPELPESLVNYTGEDVRIPRLEVPMIRVSYKSEDDDSKVCPKGEFIEYNPVTKETKALGKKVTIQILHHRQSLSAYKNEESYWTPEISMSAKEASLFLGFTKDGKRSNRFLMKGTISKTGDLRTAYPDLRYQRNLYIVHEGVLKTLVIYGASFSGFIDLTKELKGASSSSVLLELSTHKEKTGTVIYYPIAFEIKEKRDPKADEPVLKKLSEWFAKHDSLVAQQLKERANQASIDRGDGPIEEVAEVLEKSVPMADQRTMSEQMKEEKDLEDDEEKVDLKNIPF